MAGFQAASGILTAEGGKASHAALVARGMGCPAVTGVSDLDVDLHAREVRVGKLTLRKGDFIAIDGSTGTITVDDVPLVEAAPDEHFEAVLRWCDELRVLGVRANADTPQDAARAHRVRRRGHRALPHRADVHGARSPAGMRAMIMADDEPGRRAALARAATAPAAPTSKRCSRRWPACR